MRELCFIINCVLCVQVVSVGEGTSKILKKYGTIQHAKCPHIASHCLSGIAAVFEPSESTAECLASQLPKVRCNVTCIIHSCILTCFL
jgi:hypothetical protein